MNVFPLGASSKSAIDGKICVQPAQTDGLRIWTDRHIIAERLSQSQILPPPNVKILPSAGPAFRLIERHVFVAATLCIIPALLSGVAVYYMNKSTPLYIDLSIDYEMPEWSHNYNKLKAVMPFTYEQISSSLAEFTVLDSSPLRTSPSSASLSIVFLSENMLNDDNVAFTRDVENRIISNPIFASICRQGGFGECRRPNSLTKIQYATLNGNNKRYDGESMNATSSLSQAISTAFELNAWELFDRWTTTTNRQSSTLVSQFDLGLAKNGKSTKVQEVALRSKLNDMIPFLERLSTPYVRVLFEGGDILQTQVMSAIWQDIALVAVSVSLVFVCMLVIVRSLFLALIGMAAIVLTFLPTLALYMIFFQGQFSLLALSSIWILLGIIADDFFVYNEIWKESSKEFGSNQLADRLSWTMRHSLSAMFMTSSITAVGFLTNISSEVLPIQQFGVFLGSLVLIQYLTAITWVPVQRPTQEQLENPAETTTLMGRYAYWLNRFRRPAILLFILITLVMGYHASRLRSPTDGQQLLRESSNFEQIRALYSNVLLVCDECNDLSGTMASSGKDSSNDNFASSSSIVPSTSGNSQSSAGNAGAGSGALPLPMTVFSSGSATGSYTVGTSATPASLKATICPTLVPGQECSGHGDCNSRTRKCQCHTGFAGDYCSSPCVLECTDPSRGTCDVGYGHQFCSCRQGYSGQDCEINCIDDCSNAGTCSFANPFRNAQLSDSCSSLHNSCIANTTQLYNCRSYMNAGCPMSNLCYDAWTACLSGQSKLTCAFLRSTPACSYNSSDAGLNGTCICGEGYWGPACSFQCPGMSSTGACNGHGTCIKGPGPGTCVCNDQYSGEDCGLAPAGSSVHTSELRTQDSLKLSLLWGVSDVGPNKSPLWDPAFNISSTESQLFFANVCDRLKSLKDHVRPKLNCLMDAFRTYVETQSDLKVFPVPPAQFLSTMVVFLRQPKSNIFWRNIGADVVTRRPLFYRVDVVTKTAAVASANTYRNEYDFWESFVSDINVDAPVKAVQTSSTWNSMGIELSLINGTTFSVIFTVISAAIILLLFTRSLSITIMGTISAAVIFVIIIGCFQLFGWTFGVIEAISLSMMVGICVDFQLHITHTYALSSKKDRASRMFYTLRTIGCSVIWSAISTIGGTCVLMFCKVQIFVRFGQIVALDAAVGFVVALSFLSVLLFEFGPQKSQKNVLEKVGDIQLDDAA